MATLVMDRSKLITEFRFCGIVDKYDTGKLPGFKLGTVAATPAAYEYLKHSGYSVMDILWCHMVGDWGLVTCEDAAANEHAIKHGLRIMSVYEFHRGERFWVITEADRSATTLLLPSEY